MAAPEQLPLDFNATKYGVYVYGPGDFYTSRTDRLAPTRYSQDALRLAAAIGSVHRRVGLQIGAEALAAELGARPGRFYVARDLEVDSYAHPIVAYAYTEPKSATPNSVRVSALDVFDMTQTQHVRRVAAATALHAVMLHNPDASVLRIDSRNAVADSELPEGRAEDFFVDALGMTMGSELRWGEPGAYVLGQTAEVRARIEANYAVDLVNGIAESIPSPRTES